MPSFYFPRPTGKYAVGTILCHLIDGNRKEEFSNDPAHPHRELMVQMWYPAHGTLQDKANQPYIPSRVKFREKRFFYDWFKNIFSQRVYSYGIQGARISNANEKYPVIILSPGFGVTADLYTAQCEELASNGFVIVGMNHTLG